MHAMRGVTALAALVLAGCGEIPQDAPKPFAARDQAARSADERWKGDKASHEKALHDRAGFQDDYQSVKRTR
jgi:hypothetical protein